MSNKYSTTPSLQLTVSFSRYRQIFIVFLACILLLANIQIFVKGYPQLATTLSLVSIAMLWRGWRDPMVGAVLKWKGGEWFIRCNGRQSSVLLLPGAVRLPWIIYLAFRETHATKRWHIWLFADSVDVEQMRRLRCRLMLEHPG